MRTTSRLTALLRPLPACLSALVLTNLAVADPGDIGIFTDTTGGEALQPDGANTLNHTFGAGAVRSADGIALNGGADGVLLDAGHYLVIYNSRFDSAGGVERREIQSKLNLAGNDLAVGWSQAYIRRQQGQDEANTTGSGIIAVAADGDLLQLQSLRTDAENNAVTRGDQTGLQVLKLDDAWDYLRLSRTATDQAGPSGQGIANAVEVSYNTIDEAGANFGFASGGTDVTLAVGGKYLVVANTYVTTDSTDVRRHAFTQRLTLDDSEITGSRTGVYLRGNVNGDSVHDGAACIATIIEAAAGQQLSVDISHDPGSNSPGAGTIIADRTALTIVKLPDSGSYIRLAETAGTQDINDGNEVTWGTQVEPGSPAFAHTAGGGAVSVSAAGDYLFLTTLYTDDTGAARGYPESFFEVNDAAIVPYGRSGFYTRNASDGSGDGQSGGNFNGVLLALNGGDAVELVTSPLGAAGTIPLDRGGLQAVSLSSLFSLNAIADSATTDEDTVLVQVDPGNTSSLLANDLGYPRAVIASDPISSQGLPVTVNTDGTFSYDPTSLQSLNSGDMLTDTFTYTIRAGSKIDLLPAAARFDSLTDNDDGAGGYLAGAPSAAQNNAGLTFQVSFTPAPGDLDSTAAAVNLIEVGGDANGSGLYLLGGEVHFISKMNGGGTNVPAAFNDLDLSSGNNMVGAKSSFGALVAGTPYTVTAIFDPITNATLDLAVQAGDDPAVVDHFDIVGRGTKTNWSGDNSASALRAGNIGNFGGANVVGGDPFSEAAINANPFEGSAGQALYWSANTSLATDTATVTVKVTGVNDAPELIPPGIPDVTILTSAPSAALGLFAHFADVDDALNTLSYTVESNTDGTLVQAGTIDSADGILSLATPCTLKGSADITVKVQDPGGLMVSDTFTVTVVDDVAPVISGAKDLVINGPANGTVTADFSHLSAWDKVDGTITVDCSPPDTTGFTVGTHTITCTATDSSNNTATVTFELHVLAIQPPAGERVLDVLSLRNDPVIGANVPSGATVLTHNRAYLNNAGDIIFEATLLGGGSHSNAVIRQSAGGAETLLALRDTLAAGAGGGSYGNFSNLALGDSGAAIFESLVGGKVGHFLGDGAGAVSNPARAGQAAAGTAGGEFITLRKSAVTGSGEALTPANLRLNVGGVTANDDTGLWRSGGGGGLVGREGGPSPLQATAYGQFGAHAVAGAGSGGDQVAFSTFLVETPFDPSDNKALFAGPLGGALAAVVREGDVAPGTGGATFADFLSESINGAGEVAFRCNVIGTGVSSANNEGLWTNAGGPLQLVAREGQVAPCLPTTDAAFGRITTVIVGDDGTVCFFAYLKDAGMTLAVDSSNDGSLWRFDPGSGELHLIARESAIANSTDGSVYKLISGFDCSNAQGVVFQATLASGVGDTDSSTDIGVWLDRGLPDAAPELVLRRGDSFDLEGVEHTVTGITLEAQSNAGGGTGGYGRVINDRSEILMRVALNNNTSGLFKLAVPD